MLDFELFYYILFPCRTVGTFIGSHHFGGGQVVRMGRPKMLLPWGEMTVLGHLIKLWSDVLADQIAIVHASADAAIEAELDRLKLPIKSRIVNPEPDRGMFSSIQCAARWQGWIAPLTHWAIVLGDQPHLQMKTLRGVIDFAAQCPGKICQPSRHGHARHPVLLPEKAFTELALQKTKSQEFLQAMSAEVRLIEMDDPGLDLDMDHPADYEKALRLSLVIRGRRWMASLFLCLQPIRRHWQRTQPYSRGGKDGVANGWAMPIIGVSPAPAEGKSCRFTSTTSIFGASLKRGTR